MPSPRARAARSSTRWREGRGRSGDRRRDRAEPENASRHLRILGEAGPVEPRAEGQRRIYGLRPTGLAELIGWAAPYKRLPRASLDALERHLDTETKE